MKTLLFLLIAFYSVPAYAGIVVCESKGQITQFEISSPPVKGCQYYDNGQNISESQDEALRLLHKTQPIRYLKMLNGFPVEKSPPEKVAADESLALEIKNGQIARIDSGEVTGQEVLKALPEVIFEASSFKEITEENIKEKIKEQAGLK